MTACDDVCPRVAPATSFDHGRSLLTLESSSSTPSSRKASPPASLADRRARRRRLRRPFCSRPWATWHGTCSSKGRSCEWMGVVGIFRRWREGHRGRRKTRRECTKTMEIGFIVGIQVSSSESARCTIFFPDCCLLRERPSLLSWGLASPLDLEAPLLVL